jgi:hypothetical protein
VIVERWDVATPLELLLRFMMLICVVLTVSSGVLYFHKNWDLIREDLQ